MFKQNIEGGKNMARYTGSIYRKSRRLGFSVLENGKELARRPYAPGQHGNGRAKKNYLTTVLNYKKNKKLDLCME